MVVGRLSGLSDPMFFSCRLRKRSQATPSPVTGATTIAASVFLTQAEYYLEMELISQWQRLSSLTVELVKNPRFRLHPTLAEPEFLG